MANCKYHGSYSGARCPTCVQREEHVSKTLASKAQVKMRYQKLSANPPEINQDQFGICGMTSIVYLLLKQSGSRADELYKATFGDVLEGEGSDKFVTATGAQVRISLRYLCRKYQRFVEEYVFSTAEETKVKAALYDPKATGSSSRRSRQHPLPRCK
jgi:hypothetical protein